MIILGLNELEVGKVRRISPESSRVETLVLEAKPWARSLVLAESKTAVLSLENTRGGQIYIKYSECWRS